MRFGLLSKTQMLRKGESMETMNNTQHSQPKVAVYCRVAHSSQLYDGAIVSQRDRLRDFAEQQGFEVAAEYLDDGFNGLTLNRPAFMQMEAAVNAGEINTVFVHSISRIGRNFLTVGKWLSELKRRGVKLIALDGSHMLPAMPDIASLVRSLKKGQRLSIKQ